MPSVRASGRDVNSGGLRDIDEAVPGVEVICLLLLFFSFVFSASPRLRVKLLRPDVPFHEGKHFTRRRGDAEEDEEKKFVS